MRILIVGKNSFIGQGIGAYFSRKSPAPAVEYISVREDDWKKRDLSGFDAVIFTAAIVHRPDVQDWAEYERVNVQLPYAFASHAKRQGVKQFVFFSTVSVFLAPRSLPGGSIIDQNTPLAPNTMYGKSKLRAEQLLQSLADEAFCVSVIRPTYVYGKGCRGRHIEAQNLLATKLPVIPRAFGDAHLGMVYIDNLAELAWLIVHSGRCGIYHAQDKAPLSTYEILKTIAPSKKAIRCQWLLRPFSAMGVVKRLFGGSAYSEEMSSCPLGDYQIVEMEEGIRRTICAMKGETL